MIRTLSSDREVTGPHARGGAEGKVAAEVEPGETDQHEHHAGPEILGAFHPQHTVSSTGRQRVAARMGADFTLIPPLAKVGVRGCNVALGQCPMADRRRHRWRAGTLCRGRRARIVTRPASPAERSSRHRRHRARQSHEGKWKDLALPCAGRDMIVRGAEQAKIARSTASAVDARPRRRDHVTTPGATGRP